MTVFIILILAFSIIVHEVSHGLAAYKCGDDTAYLSGRLTLNPLAHVDPVGSVLVPLGMYLMGLPMFGWAKPVPFNPLRLTHPKADTGKVAFAGPLSNILLALAAVFIYKIVILAAPQAAVEYREVFSYAVFINLFLAAFNLVPLPPLDGSKVLAAFLSYEAAAKYMSLQRYGMWLVIAFIFLGGAEHVLLPAVIFIMRGFEILL